MPVDLSRDAAHQVTGNGAHVPRVHAALRDTFAGGGNHTLQHHCSPCSSRGTEVPAHRLPSPLASLCFWL